MFDVFFLSYGEPNAEENFEQLKRKAPHAQRVEGIVGIHNAYKHCANLSSTEMFYLVDGDSYILDSFEFNYNITTDDTCYLWLARDPVYDIRSYYGCLKLWPKNVVLNSGDWHTLDSERGIILDSALVIIKKKDISLNILASEHRYNTTPFNTWRTIFREYTKQRLRPRIGSNGQRITIGKVLLKVFSDYDYSPGDEGHRWYAKQGALAAENFYLQNKDDYNKFTIINDYSAMQEMFNNFNYLEH